MFFEKCDFYIVAKSSFPQGGIYGFSINSDACCVQRVFYSVPDSNWLEISPCKKVGYATGIIDGKGVIFTIFPDEPEREPVVYPVNVVGCICHIAVYPEGHRLYTANYVDGSLSELEIDDFGVPFRLVRTIRHQGCGKNPLRQEKPHVHQVNITPDRKFLAVVDLGVDEIYSYPLTPENGIDEVNVIRHKILFPGCGPRHLVFTENGNTAYLITELSNNIVSLKYCNGHFEQYEQCSSLPEKCGCESTAAAIRLSPDEKFLLITNRGHDSITACPINNGRLGKIINVSCGGEWPRDGNFIARGKYFLSANERSNRIALFHYNSVDGELENIDRDILLPAPQQIISDFRTIKTTK